MAEIRREKQKTAKFIQEEILEYQEKRNHKLQLNKVRYSKKFKNLKQKNLFNAIVDNRITFISGPAGTGKTYIALMAAMELLLKTKYNIGKLQLTKPIIEAARSLGFLKGSLKEKTEPYFDSFYDNLNKLIGSGGVKHLIENELIDETIVNFIRGNTFGSINQWGNPMGHVCILDEAQNMTIGELKTYMSRMGEHTRLIILGDEDQIDIKMKHGQMNALQWAFEYLTDINGITHYKFDEDDIVREPLLIDIMKRFKQFEHLQ